MHSRARAVLQLYSRVRLLSEARHRAPSVRCHLCSSPLMHGSTCHAVAASKSHFRSFRPSGPLGWPRSAGVMARLVAGLCLVIERAALFRTTRRVKKTSTLCASSDGCVSFVSLTDAHDGQRGHDRSGQASWPCHTGRSAMSSRASFRSGVQLAVPAGVMAMPLWPRDAG